MLQDQSKCTVYWILTKLNLCWCQCWGYDPPLRVSQRRGPSRPLSQGALQRLPLLLSQVRSSSYSKILQYADGGYFGCSSGHSPVRTSLEFKPQFRPSWGSQTFTTMRLGKKPLWSATNILPTPQSIIECQNFWRRNQKNKKEKATLAPE